MSRRNQKAKQQARQRLTASPTQLALPPELYQQACGLAEKGEVGQARALFERLDKGQLEAPLRALVRNDLAALLTLDGDVEAARAGFDAALALHAACAPARLNRALLQADVCPVPPTPNGTRQEIVRAAPRAAERERVAILSFLFNWPSTGGGNVHTY